MRRWKRQVKWPILAIIPKLVLMSLDCKVEKNSWTALLINAKQITLNNQGQWLSLLQLQSSHKLSLLHPCNVLHLHAGCKKSLKCPLSDNKWHWNGEEMYQFNCPDSSAGWDTFGCHPEGNVSFFFTSAILTASHFSSVSGFSKENE